MQNLNPLRKKILGKTLDGQIIAPSYDKKFTKNKKTKRSLLIVYNIAVLRKRKIKNSKHFF